MRQRILLFQAFLLLQGTLCLQNRRHLIVIWWCVLINKTQSFWSKTASLLFLPISFFSVTERWNFSQFAELKGHHLFVCVHGERALYCQPRPSSLSGYKHIETSLLMTLLSFIWTGRSSVQKALHTKHCFRFPITDVCCNDSDWSGW